MVRQERTLVKVRFSMSVTFEVTWFVIVIFWSKDCPRITFPMSIRADYIICNKKCCISSPGNSQSKVFIDDTDKHLDPQGQDVLVDIEETAVIGVDGPFRLVSIP